MGSETTTLQMREREELTMTPTLKNGNRSCLPATGTEEGMDEELY